MAGDVAGWRVDSGAPTPRRLLAGQLDLESRLEEWIVGDPSLVEDGFLVVARQLHLDGGPLDVLCLDAQGGLQVVELKRGGLHRETVAQAIDYAASVSLMPADALLERIRRYLDEHPNELATRRLDEQARFDLPENGRREVGVVLVGTRRDSGLDRVAEFLGEGYGLPIRVVTFQVLDLGDGALLLVREATEGASPDPPRDSAVYGWEGVLANAEKMGVGLEMQQVRDAAVELSLYPRPWKVSLMITPMHDKRRYLLTFWPKAGALGMNYSAAALSEFYGIPENESRAALGAEDRSVGRGELPSVLNALRELLARRG